MSHAGLFHSGIRRNLLALVSLWSLAAPIASAQEQGRSDAGGTAALSAADRKLLAEERAQAERLRRRGDLAGARALYDRQLDEDPADCESRALRARCRRQQGESAGALEDARLAFDQALPAGALSAGGIPECAMLAARVLAEMYLERGQAQSALECLERALEPLAGARDPRAIWLLQRALAGVGQRARAASACVQGAASPGGGTWEERLDQARCLRGLGRLPEAAQALVEADAAATAGEGTEPDVLVELASLYFEADGEVDSDENQGRSPGSLFREALALCPGHEGALLGLFDLARFNWKRQSRAADEWLADLYARRPDSIEALLAALGRDLDDGDLKSARTRIGRIEKLAPERRELATERAALAWIEHRREDSEKLLAGLLAADAADSAPEREVGRHLLELYRFAEGRPFLERAVQRDEHDWRAWTELGRALANSGDEDGARKALARAEEEAHGRANAWRSNTLAVLTKLERDYRVHAAGPLTFAWLADEAPLQEIYLAQHYASARAELAARYGYTPGPTRIEVFREHSDFSVRSTGFEGFPALGVCFGPVVTAVSPLCNLRGKFSWARTSFHEFTHVIHLGLSHNRCPRWITEGLATWEEENKNPAWSRNMRRELLDARANGDVIPVRQLNRAFRSERILFGYYQGGLLCRMWIERHGFPSMVKLLEAFDRGLDLDQALDLVFQQTPEELDAEFLAYVDRIVGALKLEPRWNPSRTAALRLSLGKQPPPEASARARWINDWISVAAGALQQGGRVEAEEALRVAQLGGAQPPRALLIAGHAALAVGDEERAFELWQRSFAAGGEDFFARLACGRALARKDPKQAEVELLLAEQYFPGFDDADGSAELALARLYEAEEREDDAMRARERWLAYNSGDLEKHLQVAGWHARSERWQQACVYYQGANEIDPFVHSLHGDWGDALAKLGKDVEALREWKAALLVPQELDYARQEPLTDVERAQLLAKQAGALVRLGQHGDARETAKQALEIDPDCEAATKALEQSP